MKTRKNFTLSDQAIEALSYLESQTHQSSSSIVEDLILTAAAGGNIPEQTLQLFDKRYSNWQKGLLLRNVKYLWCVNRAAARRDLFHFN